MMPSIGISFLMGFTVVAVDIEYPALLWITEGEQI